MTKTPNTIERTLGCDEASRHLAGFAADRSDEARKQHAKALLMKPPTQVRLVGYSPWSPGSAGGRQVHVVTHPARRRPDEVVEAASSRLGEDDYPPAGSLA